jgi:hypothetical protein
MTQEIYSQEEAQKRFAALPKDVQDFMDSPEMLNLVKGIAEKNHLHIDQLGLLEAEVSATMMGFTEPADFERMLVKNLAIAAPQAQSIAKDINDGVFIKIRESMKKTYEAQKIGTPVAISRPPALATPVPEEPAPTVPSAPLAPAMPQIHGADMMLMQKSVSVAPMAAPVATPPPPAAPKPATPATPAPVAEAPKPKPYTADPYREPIN